MGRQQLTRYLMAPTDQPEPADHPLACRMVSHCPSILGLMQQSTTRCVAQTTETETKASAGLSPPGGSEAESVPLS